MNAWSEDLRRREEALAAREAALRVSVSRNRRDAGSILESGMVDGAVIEEVSESSDTVRGEELSESVAGSDALVDETGVADVESYPVAYVPAREAVGATPGAPPVPVDGLVPLTTEIPEAMFEGTKVPLKVANLEPIEKKQPPLRGAVWTGESCEGQAGDIERCASCDWGARLCDRR